MIVKCGKLNYQKNGPQKIILIFLTISILISSVSGTVGSWNNVFVSHSPNEYMRVCCVEDQYYLMDGGDLPLYFQLPIIVEVYDKYMNPIKNVTVNVKITNDNATSSILMYKSKKLTNINGIARFGMSKKYNVMINGNRDNSAIIPLQGYGDNIYMLYVTTKNSTYEKEFGIFLD